MAGPGHGLERELQGGSKRLSDPGQVQWRSASLPHDAWPGHDPDLQREANDTCLG